MNKKGLRIFEIIWLIISVIAFIACIHTTIRLGWRNSLMMYLIFIISLLFYFYRRSGRIAAGK